MKKYATKLVNEVKLSETTYVHDNQTRDACPDCGKYLLRVKGKHGEMLVCPDRACGYRRTLTQTTNARCPNCHKKLDLRGNGEDGIFVCVCGYRERLSAFKERRAQAGAGKAEVSRFLEKQGSKAESSGGEMAAQLAKWLEQKKEP
jgi:DNA topoisomerase-3